MRAEEFLSILSEVSRKNAWRFDRLRACVPLGADEAGGVVCAYRDEKERPGRQICVTGGERTEFIRRLVVTLACLYEPSEAAFLVLSPKEEYGELLRFSHGDITVPYVRSVADYRAAVRTAEDLGRMRALNPGMPKLFIVAEGLEELPDAIPDDALMLLPYKELAERCDRNTCLIFGAETGGTIYSGYPGAIVGVGNCLVTTTGGGRAETARVGDDSALASAEGFRYPSEPLLSETISFFNSVSR